MYLPQQTYDDIRANISTVVTHYRAMRASFVQDLALPGLSENALIAAWCAIVANGMAPYGPGPYGPGLYGTDLAPLLQSPTLACNHYVTLTWYLYSQFNLAADDLTAVGWDNGAIGNHVQFLYSDGVTDLLIDPTIALVASGVTFSGLISGTPYQSYRSLLSRPDVLWYSDLVIPAVRAGAYEVRDVYYYVPGFYNWRYRYFDYTGVTIEHGNNSQTIVGDLGPNTINAGPGTDTVYGGKGDDWLDGGTGADTLYGGLGNDRFVVDDAGDQVIESVAEGTDLVYVSIANYALPANVENAYLASAGPANVTGNGLNNFIYPGAGNNAINGGYGNDTVSYYYSGAAVTVELSFGGAQDTGGSGWDTLLGVENIQGTQFADNLAGNSSANVIVGFAGNDAINGLAGADTLIGGFGDDCYCVDNPGDRVIEGAGSGYDLVYVSISAYVLPANVENAYLQARLGTALTGNALHNFIYPSAGNDAIDGAYGSDTVSYFYSSGPVVIDLSLNGPQNTIGSGRDSIIGIENAQGSNFNDFIRGNALDNCLVGHQGNDTLDGAAGADTMSGGDGNDTYYVGHPSDRVIEGNASSAVGGRDTIISSVSYALSPNVEDLILSGSASLNGAGTDRDNVLTGNSGSNRLQGGAGADVLNGGAGADTLDGGAGNDVICGGGGADLLSGGDGADLFRFERMSDGADTILDFVSGTDRIQVVSGNFGRLPLGPLAANRLIVAGAVASGPSAVFFYDNRNGALSMDSDGNGIGAPVRIANLAGPRAITASDIQVVA